MLRMMTLLLVMSLSLVSCEKSDSQNIACSSATDSCQVENVSEYVDDGNIPQEALRFEANPVFTNFTPEQQEKMEKAIEIVKLVVATEEFKNRVLNFTYNGKKVFVDNKGLSNAQIYQKILDGAETLQPAKNNTMDIELELYTDNESNVVGYTYPNTKRVWVNTKYFNKYTAAGVAHNLFHEWLHKLGFTHAISYSVSRDYSVPYAIGDIVGEIGKEFL